MWEGFSFIFCLTHLNNNFDSSHGEFNVMTGNFDNFLGKRKKFHFRFLTCFWIYCAESSIFRGIHPEIFGKITFLRVFSKLLKKFLCRSRFQRGFRSKTWLFCFWCFLNSYTEDYLEFSIPVRLLAVITFLPQRIKERIDK